MGRAHHGWQGRKGQPLMSSGSPGTGFQSTQFSPMYLDLETEPRRARNSDCGDDGAVGREVCGSMAYLLVVFELAGLGAAAAVGAGES
jgi:hypothetical protein